MSALDKAGAVLEAGIGSIVVHTKANLSENFHRTGIAITAVIVTVIAQKDLHQQRSIIEGGEGIQNEDPITKAILTVVTMHDIRKTRAEAKDATGKIQNKVTKN
eukprot:606065-Karenia_brevis.AAC.1